MQYLVPLRKEQHAFVIKGRKYKINFGGYDSFRVFMQKTKKGMDSRELSEAS